MIDGEQPRDAGGNLFLAWAMTLALVVTVAIPAIADEPSDATITPTGKIETLQEGFAFTEGPAWDPRGTLLFTDIPNSTIHRFDTDGQISAFTKSSGHANGLLVVDEGRLLACQMDGQVVSYDIDSGETTVLASEYQGTRFNAPNDLVTDSDGGIYFTDPLFRAPQPLPQGVQAVYYIDAERNVSRVTGDLAAPNGIGLSPDGSKLYVIPSRQAEMLVYDIDGPGKLSGGRTFCRLTQPEGKAGTGGDGMAMDVQGNLYITTNLGVEVFSSEGVSRGVIEFPQQPANVTFGGSDRKTMYVTARTGLYRVAMPIAGLPPK